jgi:hypothetical protein
MKTSRRWRIVAYRLKNAVNIKLKASANVKLTTTDALVLASFKWELAKNQAMVNCFNRLLQKLKLKEVADGEPPAPPVWPLQLPPLGAATQGPD